MMKITGKIDRQGFGTGTWALLADNGQTYELKDIPSELESKGIKVEIEGEIREDVMTLAMIGPVLEVKNYKKL